MILTRTPKPLSLAHILIQAAVMGNGLAFVEQQMFGHTLGVGPTPSPKAIDMEKREIRRLTRQDRHPSKHRVNKARRGF